jgi:uncharacterized protein
MSEAAFLVLALTSAGAATVNGALGYGYSSITVPIALFVIAGRVLNPAIVIVEVAINLYALWWHRRDVRRVAGRTRPLVIGLVPGVIAGAVLLALVRPSDVRIGAFSVLLPLILLQASGLRWPIARERTAAVPLGAGVGLLYGLTTISGPPLALFWNNQGLARDDFKVALAIARTVESTLALVAYAALGLLTRDSAGLLPWIAPGVLIGFPLGGWLIRHLRAETFRRVCMSFDAYLVSLGLARGLVELGLVPPALAYQLVAVTAVVDTWLLHRFFRLRSPFPPRLGAHTEVPS